MDSINTQIGQGIAKQQTSMVNTKTFAASNMVGVSGGVSHFAKSETALASQQVKNAEKTRVNLFEEQVTDTLKKTKANRQNADTDLRKVNIGFSQSLDNINQLMQTNGTKISFNFENRLKNGEQEPIVIITDKESGDVIRQIPTEEMQKFAERVRELESGATSRSGLMVNLQA